MPIPAQAWKVGDLVAFHKGEQILFGKLTNDRGSGVFKAQGEFFVDAGNYLAHLYPANP